MRVLGIDYGQRRIGLALSDVTGLLARPWKTMPRTGSTPQVAAGIAREVAALQAEEEGLATVVVGWPRRLSGEANEQTKTVESLVAHLRASLAIPIVLQDERLTSWEADYSLMPRERDWRKRKSLLDMTSAAIILQDYLDAQPRRPSPEDLDT